MKKILITGAAGFIGSYLTRKLLEDGYYDIVGVDNLNDYYDVNLKKERLKYIDKPNFRFIKADIANKGFVKHLFETEEFDIVVNLAAQAGVRYSLINPDAYMESNVTGFYNLLETMKDNKVEHFIYASSSSVYGNNDKVPFSSEDKVDKPASLYAATKKFAELLAYTYNHLYGIKSTGLRFFTVYGPMGRPDMAYFSFTNKLINDEKIKIFNYGNCQRDFTYIDDIVEGIYKIIEKGPINDYNIYNIGNNHPENLMDFVKILADSLIKYEILDKDFNIEDHMELVEKQKGDVDITYADVNPLINDYGFKPDTPLKEGLEKFAKWYKEYYL